MGTSIYMDDTGKALSCNLYMLFVLKFSIETACILILHRVGTIDMSNAHEREQDVRFDSSVAWVWWPLIQSDRKLVTGGTSVDAECIDCRSGFACNYDDERQHENEAESTRKSNVSLVSSSSLVQLFAHIKHKEGDGDVMSLPTTLKQLRALKRDVSPEYEAAKDKLLSNHRVFRQWRRREYEWNQR